jgi:hypothetical protein
MSEFDAKHCNFWRAPRAATREVSPSSRGGVARAQPVPRALHTVSTAKRADARRDPCAHVAPSPAAGPVAGPIGPRAVVRRRPSGTAAPLRPESLAYSASRRRTTRAAPLRTRKDAPHRPAAPESAHFRQLFGHVFGLLSAMFRPCFA